jgi:hypothetical protein
MNALSFSYYIHDEPAVFDFALDGPVAAAGVRKPAQDSRNGSSVIGTKQLAVGISRVTEIDSRRRERLLHWSGNGAAIVANRAESRAFAESTIGLPLPAVARIPNACRPARWGSFFRCVVPIGLLIVLGVMSAPAQRLPIVQPITPTTNERIAFARYIAWLQAGDPFTEAGPVALSVVASLPGLEKQGRLVAIRAAGESARSQYGILDLQGDSIVFQWVIAPYLVAQHQAEDIPLSSVVITPRNYNFHYAGEVETGDQSAYVFRITPKKNRAGLIRGELWIEPVTGAPVLVTGDLVKTPSTSIRSINVVREITFVNGCPCVRTTHMTIETRPVGLAELTIVELPLGLFDQGAAQPLLSEQNRR